MQNTSIKKQGRGTQNKHARTWRDAEVLARDIGQAAGGVERRGHGHAHVSERRQRRRGGDQPRVVVLACATTNECETE